MLSTLGVGLGGKGDRETNQTICHLEAYSSIMLFYTAWSFITTDCQINGDQLVARQLEIQEYRTDAASLWYEFIFEMFVKNCEGSEIFLSLKAMILACHSLIDAGRRHVTSESEKDFIIARQTTWALCFLLVLLPPGLGGHWGQLRECATDEDHQV